MTSTLSPGEHSYESILEGIDQGRYRFARVRTASGRLNYFIGFSPAQMAAVRAFAARRRLGLAILGSRVSGPRLRQRTLHPALAAALPLVSTKRTPSPTYAGSDGLEIEKRQIKEFGRHSPHTSDVSIILIDPRRSPGALFVAAAAMEQEFRRLGCPFPIKAFPGLEGRTFRSEREFQAFGTAYLRRNLPPGAAFSDRELVAAFRELYMSVGLPAAPIGWSDLTTGLWNGALAAISFSLALKFHPAIFAVGFAFGLFGRHVARLKAWVADAFGDGFASNTAALAADAAIGIGAMAGLINPAAGLGLPFRRIVWTSLLHTLSKGSLRLYLDKVYSRGDRRRQTAGVFLTTSLNFLQGLATAYIYAGSRAAVVLQAGTALLGLSLVYRAPLARALRRLRKV